MKGLLVLEDGTIFEGVVFGSLKSSGGEVVFNTSMTGYQEIMTDPSYNNQIVVMTYPLIGNYGYNEADMESEKAWLKGFVVKELCQDPSNWRSTGLLEEFMKKNKIIGIKDIDTRALTGKIRDEGVMKGIITPVEDKDFNDAKVPNDANNVKEVKEAKALPSENELNLVKEVTTGYKISVGTGDMKIALIDFGVKMNIVRSLQEFGFTVTIYPAYTPPSEILKDKPDGIVLSNGPGDPKTLGEIIENTKELINSNIPIMGICLGHQILSLAFGAKTYKLKFGHRGGNHPIKDLQKNKVYITSQNHGYAVDESTLPSDVEITHINLNDKTVEGIRHKSLPIFSIQYHPEASPGPMDSVYLFEGFKEMIENKLKEEGKGGNNNARK